MPAFEPTLPPVIGPVGTTLRPLAFFRPLEDAQSMVQQLLIRHAKHEYPPSRSRPTPNAPPPPTLFPCLQNVATHATTLQVKRETVLRDQAYVLFYTRRPAPKPVVASIPPAPSLAPAVKVSSTASAAAVGKPAATASAAVPETKRKKLVPEPEGKELVGVSPRQGLEGCNGNRGGVIFGKCAGL